MSVFLLPTMAIPRATLGASELWRRQLAAFPPISHNSTINDKFDGNFHFCHIIVGKIPDQQRGAERSLARFRVFSRDKVHGTRWPVTRVRVVCTLYLSSASVTATESLAHKPTVL